MNESEMNIERLQGELRGAKARVGLQSLALFFSLAIAAVGPTIAFACGLYYGNQNGRAERDRDWGMATGFLFDSLTYSPERDPYEVFPPVKERTPERLLQLTMDRASELRKEQGVCEDSILTFGIREIESPRWIPSRGR